METGGQKNPRWTHLTFGNNCKTGHVYHRTFLLTRSHKNDTKDDVRHALESKVQNNMNKNLQSKSNQMLTTDVHDLKSRKI